MRRLENAKNARDRLLKELKEVWAFLEDGNPGMEDGTSSISRKRKKSLKFDQRGKEES